MTRSAIVTLLLAASLASAQDLTGNWLATPADSGALRHLERLVLKLTRGRQGAMVGTVYAGSFGDQLFSCNSIQIADSKVTLAMESQGSAGARNQASFGRAITFSGVLSSDGKSIDGWVQGVGFHERLKFQRMGRAPAGVSHEKTSIPPITAAIPSASTADSAAVLSRSLEKLASTHRQLLKHTCLETIDRSYFSVPPRKPGRDVMTEAPAPSCNGREFGGQAGLALAAEDRLRLEVAVADGKEIDSWASASSFDSRSIHEVVSTGPTSTGAFGTALVDIFENPAAHFVFLGKETKEGRDCFQYSFEIPLDASNYRVGSEGGWKNTAYHGSFEIDPTTAELTRVFSETADLPPEARACRYRTSTDYRYQPIGGGQYLIPTKSSFDVLLPSGNEDRSAIVFSGCHEYGAESSLILDGETPRSVAHAGPKTGRPLPPGISLSFALVTPIDTLTVAAGDAVTARVTKAVRAPESNEILVAAGAIAHGRIVQMRHEIFTGKFLIAIRYDTLEQNGSVTPLAVRLDRELRTAQEGSRSGFATRGSEFALPPAGTSGEAGTWFTLSAADGHAIVAAGSETKWITVAQ